ncbi:MAG: RHS repeat-associated core domain-containing protein [Acidobacteriota bacterium]
MTSPFTIAFRSLPLLSWLLATCLALTSATTVLAGGIGEPGPGPGDAPIRDIFTECVCIPPFYSVTVGNDCTCQALNDITNPVGADLAFLGQAQLPRACGQLVCFDMTEQQCADNEAYWGDFEFEWNGHEPECCVSEYRVRWGGLWDDCSASGSDDGDYHRVVSPDNGVDWEIDDNWCARIRSLDETHQLIEDGGFRYDYRTFNFGAWDPCRYECQAYRTSVVHAAPPDCPIDTSMSCGEGEAVALGRGEFQLHEVDFTMPGLSPSLPVTMARTHRSRVQDLAGFPEWGDHPDKKYLGSDAFGESWFFPWEMRLRSTGYGGVVEQIVLEDGRGKRRIFVQDSWNEIEWRYSWSGTVSDEQLVLVDPENCEFELIAEDSTVFEFETTRCDLSLSLDHAALQPYNSYHGLYPLGQYFEARLKRVVDAFGNHFELQYEEREEKEDELVASVGIDGTDWMRHFHSWGRPTFCEEENACHRCLFGASPFTVASCEHCESLLDDFAVECLGLPEHCTDDPCFDCGLVRDCTGTECEGVSRPPECQVRVPSYGHDLDGCNESPCFDRFISNPDAVPGECSDEDMAVWLEQCARGYGQEPKTPSDYLTAVLDSEGREVLSFEWRRFPNAYGGCLWQGDCWFDRVVSAERQDGATWTYEYDHREYQADWFEYDVLGRPVDSDPVPVYPEGDSWPGMLVSVTSPPVEGLLGFPSGSSERLVRRYGYGMPPYADFRPTVARLATLRDENGHLVFENAYYDDQVELTPEQLQDDGDCGNDRDYPVLLPGRLARRVIAPEEPDPRKIHYHYTPAAPDPEVPSAWIPGQLSQQAALDVFVNDHGRVSRHGMDVLGRETTTWRYHGLADPDELSTADDNLPTDRLRADDPEFHVWRTEHRGVTNKASFRRHPNGNQVASFTIAQLNPRPNPRLVSMNCRLPKRFSSKPEVIYRFAAPLPPEERWWHDPHVPEDFGLVEADQPRLATNYWYDFDQVGSCDDLRVYPDSHGVVLREREHEHPPRYYFDNAKDQDGVLDVLRRYNETFMTEEDWWSDLGAILQVEAEPDAQGRLRLSRVPEAVAGLHGIFGDDSRGGGTEVKHLYHESGPAKGLLRETIVDVGGLEHVTRYEYDDGLRVRSITDPMGNETLFEYNVLGWLLKERSPEIDPDGDGPLPAYRISTAHHYDRRGRVVRSSHDNLDHEGRAVPTNPWWITYWDHDGRGRLTEERRATALGQHQAIQHDYNVFGQVVETRRGGATSCDAPWDRTAFEYDALGRLYRQTEAPKITGGPCGALGTSEHELVTQTDYDGNGNVTRTVVGAGTSQPRITTMKYDGHDRLRRVIEPTGTVRNLSYDWRGGLVSEEIVGDDGRGSPKCLSHVEHEFDALGRNERSSQAFFDTLGSSPVLDGLGDDEPTCATATSGALIEDGTVDQETVWCYGCSLVLQETDHYGNETDHYYDGKERRRLTRDPLGNETEWIHDANDNVLFEIQRTISDLTGEVTTRTWSHGYDALSRRTWTQAPDGGLTRFHHDSLGRVTLTVGPRGTETELRYDGLGRLLRTERHPRPGAPPEEQPIVTEQRWNGASWLVAQVDANGNETLYGHDDRGRVETTTYEDGTVRTVLHDVFGNEQFTQEPDDVTRSQSWHDIGNRLTAKSVSSGDGGADPDTTIESYSYDGLNRIVKAVDDDSVVERAYDSLGGMTREAVSDRATGRSFPVRKVLDANGLVREKTYPSGRVLEITPRTATGPLSEVYRIEERSPNPRFIATYSYLGRSRPEQVLRGRGLRTTTTYDAAGRAKLIDHVSWETPIGGHQYEWDLAGNRIEDVDQRTGVRRTYDYDSFDRLTTSTIQSGSATPVGTVYDLDGVHNRRSVTIGGGAPGLYYMDATPLDEGGPADFQLNEYTSTPFGKTRHDLRGNTSWQEAASWNERAAKCAYDHDYRNRLVRARCDNGDREVEFSRDVFGRVFRKDVTELGTTTTTYRAHDQLQVIEEYDADGEVLASYVHGVGLDALVQADIGGEELWFSGDDLASTRVVTDHSGYVQERIDYDDYGWPIVTAGSSVESVSSVGNPFLFAGRRWEPELGWYDNRARYLDPRIGRFTTRDPIGLWGDDLNWGNGYAYVGSNPLSAVDPLGLEEEGIGDFLRDVWDTTRDGIADAFEEAMTFPDVGLPVAKEGFSQVADVHLVEADRAIEGLTGRRILLEQGAYDPDASHVVAAEQAFDARDSVRAVRDVAVGGVAAIGEIAEAGAKFARKNADAVKETCFAADTPVLTPTGLVDIDAIELGDAVVVVGRDVGRVRHSSTAIDEGDTNGGCLAIETQGVSDTGEPVRIDLLRTRQWAASQGAAVGRWLTLQSRVLAMGAALVVNAEPCDCPRVATAGESVVTGRFVYDRAVLPLHVEGLTEPIQTTPDHPFYSLDRQAWVLAGELLIGESLQTAAGATTVRTVGELGEPVPVFNLEVGGVHEFAITRMGIRVHNDCEVDYYRGAKPGEEPDFTPRPRVDYKTDANGHVKPTHGVSVFDNAGSVKTKGFDPHKVDQESVPDQLRIIQRGNDPHHHEIVPKPEVKLTPDEYAEKLKEIKTTPE